MSINDRVMAINSHLNGNHGESMAPRTESEKPFAISNQWHSKPGHLRVIGVGAGAAGLLLAYKMQKDFTEYNLVIYEKYVSSQSQVFPI